MADIKNTKNLSTDSNTKVQDNSQAGEKIPLHWAFSAVRKTIAEHGEQKLYTCASGVTPSGVIHIGNFREIITVDLVYRAFKIMGKNARHLHSWDSYDVFRKVPKNMPHPEILEKHLRMSIVDTPDTTLAYGSYAEKHLKNVEEVLPLVGIKPEYKYQAELYKKCTYADSIKQALEKTPEIKDVLNQFRKEPLADSWLPVSVFCDSCLKDTITSLRWNGGYSLTYTCECGHTETFDFREKGIAKLSWRIDWPMRWAYEDVHFEPGGKDHSSQGGSFSTSKEIVKRVWNRNPPTYIMYDFISIKGRGGKISSSGGEVVTLQDCLEIYEPEIVRYLFAGTRPNAEFAISFDADVIKIYEDYDLLERSYYGLEKLTDKEKEKVKWVYELSQVDTVSEEMPVQISFRELTMILCIKNLDVDRVYNHFKYEVKNDVDEKRLKTRIACAKKWLTEYADEQFRFIVREEKNESFFSTLSDVKQKALTELKAVVSVSKDVEELNTLIFEIPKSLDMKMGDFFKLCYQALISRDRGPKLANFIFEIGRERVMKLL